MASISRTPEGEPNHCPVCGQALRVEPSRPPGDAPCPYCGHLLWFDSNGCPSPHDERLDRCFQYAAKQMSEGRHEFAVELFAQCARGEPGNARYIRGYIECLQKKYRNNRKGATLAHLKELDARGAIKRALVEQRWRDVIEHGMQVLAVNPWDVPTLTTMAREAEASGNDACGAYYRGCAVEAQTS